MVPTNYPLVTIDPDVQDGRDVFAFSTLFRDAKPVA
jgi:hypothetical protein